MVLFTSSVNNYFARIGAGVCDNGVDKSVFEPPISYKTDGQTFGVKGRAIAVVTGILSVGAFYVWFPVLKEMIGKES